MADGLGDWQFWIQKNLWGSSVWTKSNPQHILWTSAFSQKFAEVMGTTKLSFHLKDHEEEESKSVSSSPTQPVTTTLSSVPTIQKRRRIKWKKKKKWMHVSGSILQKLLLLHLSALVGFFKGLHIGEGKPISSLCNLYLDNQCLVADFSSDWARTAHLSFSVPQKPGQSLLITIIPIITSFFLQWTVPLSGQQQWIPSNYQT